jgi:hypothetical protein
LRSTRSWRDPSASWRSQVGQDAIQRPLAAEQVSGWAGQVGDAVPGPLHNRDAVHVAHSWRSFSASSFAVSWSICSCSQRALSPGSPPSSAKPTRGRHRLARVRPADGSLVAEHRSAGGRRDRAGPNPRCSRSCSRDRLRASEKGRYRTRNEGNEAPGRARHSGAAAMRREGLAEVEGLAPIAQMPGRRSRVNRLPGRTTPTPHRETRVSGSGRTNGPGQADLGARRRR